MLLDRKYDVEFVEIENAKADGCSDRCAPVTKNAIQFARCRGDVDYGKGSASKSLIFTLPAGVSQIDKEKSSWQSM